MKILHLFSDWKWTGPAEPVFNLCLELQSRGHDVTLCYQRPPHYDERTIESMVRHEALKATDRFALNHELRLTRPVNFFLAIKDLFSLAEYIRKERFDIVNVHHSHDHVIGGIAARIAGGDTIVVRTDHQRTGIKPGFGNRLLVSKFADGIVTFSERVRREDISRFGLSEQRVCRVNPALRLERYVASKRVDETRSRLGITPDDIVIGMVARFQRYRRTDIALEALRYIAPVFPNVKLLLVGRSSQMEESVLRPMKELGIERSVVLAGYRTTDYLDVLDCMDIFVFLMPGSDGTARALREAMAMGKPAVVSNEGMLPELVEDGVNGWVVDLDARQIADAVSKLIRSRDLRESMGKASAEIARRNFRLDNQAKVVEDFYIRLMSMERQKKAGRKFKLII